MSTPFGEFDTEPPLQRIGPGRFDDLPALIAEQVPELSFAVDVAFQSQTALISLIMSDTATHPAIRLVFCQTVNDLIDLLADIPRGRGRAAIRTSRSLIEHAINLHTVANDLKQAQRYVDHLDLGLALMFELEIGADSLDRKTKSQYRHNLKRIGRGARRRFDAAKANWGGGFARSWSDKSLADRAASYDLTHLYGYYRLTSLVTHGSAGGILGTVRQHHEGDTSTFRTGQALELAPVALQIGVKAYLSAIAALGVVREDINLSDYISGMQGLLDVWPKYYKGLMRLDDTIWPKYPAAPAAAVLVLSRSGRRRWYLHLPWASILLPAEEPDLTPQARASLDDMSTQVLSNPDEHFVDGTDGYSFAFFGVPVRLADRGAAIPDTAVLLRRRDLPEDWTYERVRKGDR